MTINPTTLNTPYVKAYIPYQNPRGGISASNQSVSTPTDSKNISFEKLLAAYTGYTFPAKIASYKEIETFKVPNVGQGKVYELSNGHKVVILPKKGTTTINTFVKAGQYDSFVGKEGLAHILEHMIYNDGNKINGVKFSEFLGNMGSQKSATTNYFYTNYEMKYSFHDMENIEKLIKTQAELLQNPNFTQGKFDTERNVILAEYGENKSGEVEEKRRQYLINYLFNLDPQNGFRYKIDSEQTNKNISKEDLINFHYKYYTDNNMITAIVGDVDPDQIIKVFGKYFNKPKNNIRNNIQETNIDFSNPIKNTKRIDIKSIGTDDIQIRIGFVGPKNSNDKDDLIAIALKSYINDLDNARSEKVLKDFNKPFYKSTFIEMQQVGFSKISNDPSVITFSSHFKHGEEEKGLKSIYQLLYGLSQSPISEKELEAVKAHLKNTYSTIKEDSSLLAYFLGSDMAENKNIGLIKANELIDNLTAKDLQDFAKKYINLNKALILVEHPDNPENKEIRQVNNVGFNGNSNKIGMNNVKEYKYPNNLLLAVDSSPNATRTVFSLNFESTGIPLAKPGAAFILSMMLNRNSSKYSKEQYDEIVKTNGLEIGSDAHADANSIFSTVECTPDKTITAINLLKDKLLYPDLSQERFEKIKKTAKEALSKLTDKKPDIEHNELYGDNYPFYYSNNKELENIDNITLSDVINLYNQIMSTAQGRAALTISQETFNTIQNSIFASLGAEIPMLQQNQYINWAQKLNIQPLSQTKVFTRERNENQANVIQTFKIIESGNINDKASIQLLETILNKKLFNDIREKQGLGYSASTDYERTGRINLLKLETITPTNADLNGNNENVKKVLESYKNNINDLINLTISQEELDLAKTILKSGIANQFEHSSERNNILKDGMYTAYGINYINDILTAIDKVTPAGIQNAAKYCIDKPSIISIHSNQEAIDKNKDYLSSLGEVESV